MRLQRIGTVAALSAAVISVFATASVGAEIETITSMIQEHHELHPLKEGMAFTLEGVNEYLSSLDNYSRYYTREEYDAHKKRTQTILSGIGVHVLQTGDMYLAVPYIESPAYDAGFTEPKLVMLIDDVPVIDYVNAIGTEAEKEHGEKVTIYTKKHLFGPTYGYSINIGYFAKPTVEWLIKGGMNIVRIHDIRGGKTAREVEEILDALDEEHPNLILDLRYSPGGSLKEAADIASLFLPDDTDMITLEDAEGKKDRFVAIGDEALHGYTLPILVSQHTASSAEIITMVLKYWDKATVIGETTKGKCKVQQTFELDEGDAITLTVYEAFDPGHTSCQGVGVDPDYAFQSYEVIDTDLMVRWIKLVAEGERHYVCRAKKAVDRRRAMERIPELALAMNDLTLDHLLMRNEEDGTWTNCVGPKVTLRGAQDLQHEVSELIGEQYFVLSNPWQAGEEGLGEESGSKKEAGEKVKLEKGETEGKEEEAERTDKDEGKKTEEEPEAKTE